MRTNSELFNEFFPFSREDANRRKYIVFIFILAKVS
jgi:hypothetical protein